MRLIDADALEFYDEIYDEETGEYIKYVTMEQIEASPTIDLVKHGHWEMNNTYYRCSVCKESDAFGLSNYCKCCGAKMDVQVHDGDWLL